MIPMSGQVAQEVVEEATSIIAHIINFIRQVASFVYTEVRRFITYLAENPLYFFVFAVNIAILLGE